MSYVRTPTWQSPCTSLEPSRTRPLASGVAGQLDAYILRGPARWPRWSAVDGSATKSPPPPLREFYSPGSRAVVRCGLGWLILTWVAAGPCVQNNVCPVPVPCSLQSTAHGPKLARLSSSGARLGEPAPRPPTTTGHSSAPPRTTSHATAHRPHPPSMPHTAISYPHRGTGVTPLAHVGGRMR